MLAIRRIAAVVLTYRPDEDILRRAVVTLCSQVDQIVIVNNGAAWNAEALLDALPDTGRRKIEFIWLDTNVGVGAGHNRGIAWARARGFTHVLILDHDSLPGADTVRHLVAALDRLDAQGIPVAAVGPRCVDRYTGYDSAFVRLDGWKLKQVFCDAAQTGEMLETDFIISSGALIPMAVLDEIGDMNEGFFIDHVDTEWIFRAKARGYRCYGVCDAVMGHSLGTATLRFWLGRWRNMPIHSPERHYYVFRNSIILLRMPHAPRRWIQSDIVRLISMALVYPVFTPNRWQRVRLMALGIWHGLRGVTGPLR